MFSTDVRITLVEDNPGDVQLIEEAFQTLTDRCVFTIFSDGQAAIDFINEAVGSSAIDLPQLIILDLNLPKRSGMEVLEVIKKHNELKSVPVIIFSSSEAFKDIETSYQLQANCYIVKPFDFDAFFKVINEIWRFWFETASLP